MSPPMSRSQPRREFGSPTAKFIRSIPSTHTKAKFHIDLTQDSDSVAPESDSDEPVFVKSQTLDRQQQQARVDFDSLRGGLKSTASGFFGKLAARDIFTRPGTEHIAQQQPPPPPPPPHQQQSEGSFQSPTSFFGHSSARQSPSNSAIRGNVHPYHGSSSRGVLARPVPSPTVPPVLGGNYNHQGRPSSRSLLLSRSPPSTSSLSSSVPPKLQERPATNGVGTTHEQRPSTRDSHVATQITPPSSSRFDTSGQQSPNPNAMGEAQKRTPQKVDWSVDKLANALQDRTIDMRKSHQDLVSFTIHSVKPVERRVMSGVDWFATVSHEPVAPEVDKTDEMLKIRIKHHHARGKKDQSNVFYEPLLFKTSKPRVPKYRFHHKEITRNVLTPNTMLKFVPVIRDLNPGEDAQYNTWLKELERMDASCGFQPMGSREQRVIRTTRQERTSMLALYLDFWIERLGITGCNRTTLIRHMVQSESDVDMTPHQKKMCNTLQSDGNSPSSPVAARMSRMFTEAFDRIFSSDAVPEERQVKLRDVLQLDRSVEEIFESKKTVKNSSQSQSQDATPDNSFEKILDTYAIMGCLICFSNSCEHGDYGEKNEKRNFSLDCNGRIEELFLKAPGAAEKRDHDGTRIEPCRRDCYMVRHDIPDSVPGLEPWRPDDENLLRSMFAAVECSSRVRSKAQCMVAEILNRRCWEVQHHLTKLNVVVHEDTRAKLPKAKTLPWYDRHKKLLMGDWQSETYTHDPKSRLVLDPCRHDGPCSEANGCECVINHVLCDKFCRCTADCCSYKFTGCACGSTGKTCLQRQKEGRPCICVQLNRECDPSLCHGCGVKERAHPSNRDNDALLETGCQNCSLQQGRSKAVVPGQSQLEGCGYGLFAVEAIAQHEFVIEYTGELIMHDEGVRREARRGEAFDEDGVTSYVFSLLDSEGIWVDAAIYGNHSRYINHEAYDYNVEPKVLYVNGEYRIRFSATRYIEAGEELFFNYGGNFPNLTKKMIKDKTQASDGSEPEPEPEPTKKRGRPPGKTGRPAKKAQAMRKEAPVPQAETLDDLDKLDVTPVPRGRKRRHIEIIEQDESDDYHPSMEESESREARAQAREARRQTKRRLENIEPDDVGETHRGSSRRRRTRRSEVEPEPGLGPGTPTPLRKKRGRPPKRQSTARSESPVDGADDEEAEETPGRGRRKRQLSSKRTADTEMDKEIVANTAAAAADDAEDSTQPRTPTTRYGRRRSRRVAESDDEITPKKHDAADSADETLSYSGDFSRSNSRTRRERRKPARYRDSEEPL